MSRSRARRMTPERMRRHEQGVRRLDEAFGYSGSGPGVTKAETKRRLLDMLGFRGFDAKAIDE
jgi:hypothetical protein